MRVFIGEKPPFGVAPPVQADSPLPTLEGVAETAALLEAISAVHGPTRPSNRQLSRIAEHLRKNPKLRMHPVMSPYLELILARFVADYSPSEPGSVAKGFMVEFWDRDGTAASLRKARRQVADLLKMSLSTLREACRAFRSQWAKKEAPEEEVPEEEAPEEEAPEEKASEMVGSNPDSKVS